MDAILSNNWNSLIKPNKNIVGSLNHCTMIFEPLEPGFGISLGNILRRTLLSSLQGAAVTAIIIDSVVHEFSSVSNVREDVVDIVLKLKELSIKMHSEEKKSVRLDVTGPKEVYASMIETGADVDIINKDLLICTLDAGAHLQMEIIVETGKGYVSASKGREEANPIGLIPIDALFSPVKRVAYNVTNSRVGQITDYDKLSLEVETNGTIPAETAVAYAARIIQDQLQPFINFNHIEDKETFHAENLPFDPYLLKKVEELELSVRSQNCLKNENISYIGDLVRKTENEMLRTPNFGRKSLNEIKEVLSLHNLKFGTDIAGWPPENIDELSKKYEDPY